MAVEREVLIERTATGAFEGLNISWGGVFGGVLAGIGTLLLLSSLGLAIGVSAVDPTRTDGADIGRGAAIWTGLTLLVALFVGGWASTRLSMLWERTTAMFEGVLVWVLSLILILYLAASGISLIAGGMLGSVATGEATSRTEAARGDPAQAAAQIGSDVDDLASRATQNGSAAQVQPRVAMSAWITFGALLLSLIAAIAGAAVGRRGVVGRVSG
jgi:ABC-type transport system involved in multi-copper enzyme maturation permease subunit